MKLKIIIFLLFVSTNLFAQKKSNCYVVDTTIYKFESYKSIVEENTSNLFSYLSSLISQDLDRYTKEEKLEKASLLFLKSDETRIQNIFTEFGFVSGEQAGYETKEFLNDLFSFKNKDKIRIDVDQKNIKADDVYKNISQDYFLIKVKADIKLVKPVIDKNGDEEEQIISNKEIDVFYRTVCSGEMKIYAISQHIDKISEDCYKVTPLTILPNIPGSKLQLRIAPKSSSVRIDNKQIDYVYNKKIPIEYGKHIIEIIPPNDDYERIEPFEEIIDNDTGTFVIEQSLNLKDGTLTLEPGNDCMNGVQVNIYRMVEEVDYKGRGKNKTQVINLVKERNPMMNIFLPVNNLSLPPGNYKLVMGKNDYKIKKMDIAIVPNLNTNRSVILKDLGSIMGPVSDVACTMFCPKGGNCCCCAGSGKCRICKGSGYRVCSCCAGKGSFYFNNTNKMCSVCNGSGKVLCNSCKGGGSCSACKGSGKN